MTCNNQQMPPRGPRIQRLFERGRAVRRNRFAFYGPTLRTRALHLEAFWMAWPQGRRHLLDRALSALRTCLEPRLGDQPHPPGVATIFSTAARRPADTWPVSLHLAQRSPPPALGPPANLPRYPPDWKRRYAGAGASFEILVEVLALGSEPIPSMPAAWSVSNGTVSASSVNWSPLRSGRHEPGDRGIADELAAALAQVSDGKVVLPSGPAE